MPGRTQFVGSGATASSRSAPVTTVTTPGILTARSTETDRIRACACGLRNRATCKVPAASADLMSSVNRPRPRR